MKKYFLFAAIFISSLCQSEVAKISSSYGNVCYEQIEIGGHQFLNFMNGWTGSSVGIMHDPSCPKCCVSESIDDFIDGLKEAFPPSDESAAIHALGQEIKKSLAMIQEEINKKDKKKKK